MKIEIPMKLPSLNEVNNKNRYNRYAGAKYKKDLQHEIGKYINYTYTIQKPVKIHFHWIER